MITLKEYKNLSKLNNIKLSKKIMDILKYHHRHSRKNKRHLASIIRSSRKMIIKKARKLHLSKGLYPLDFYMIYQKPTAKDFKRTHFVGDCKSRIQIRINKYNRLLNIYINYKIHPQHCRKYDTYDKEIAILKMNKIPYIIRYKRS